MKDFFWCDFKGLTNIGNRNNENGIADSHSHAVHNRHGERNVHCESASFSIVAGNRHRTADCLNIFLHHVHAYASARELGDLLISGKAGKHDKA